MENIYLCFNIVVCSFWKHYQQDFVKTVKEKKINQTTAVAQHLQTVSHLQISPIKNICCFWQRSNRMVSVVWYNTDFFHTMARVTWIITLICTKKQGILQGCLIIHRRITRIVMANGRQHQYKSGIFKFS